MQALTAELKETAEALEASKAENEVLKAKLEKADDAVAASPSAIPTKKFKSGGNSYGFNAANFRINKKKYTAEEALKDQKVLDMIVTSFPGLVTKA